MQCILCEKPSAAANYAKALGGRKGTFNGKKYEIVNSVGHIYEMLKNPEEQVKDELKEKYKNWDISSLPWHAKDLTFRRVLKADCKEVNTAIKEAAEKCDEIVIATDDDVSGEGTLLAIEVIAGLKLKDKHYYRSFHIDESPKEIQKAMKNLTDLGNNPMNDPDFKKANFRSKWDYLSMQWTRLFCKLGDGSLLRQGRLKSYMVWAVGEQTKLAQGYKKIPYYQNRFKDENGNIYTSKKEETYPNESDVPNKYKASEVVIDKTETKYSSPPALYDLSMLSASLAPKGYTSKQVLNTYQKMYEDHIVSYPRTDDKTITNEQFNEFLINADKIADLVGVDKSLLTHRTPRKTHVVDSGSHGANRPGSVVPSSLKEIESDYGECGVLIYKFVAHNSLAMLCEDYEYLQEKGHIKDYPDFVGVANIPQSLGFKQIFNDEKEEDAENLGKHLGKNATPFIYEGFPPKPNMPTAKWLANLLKKNDVGTGATRTSIYGEITDETSKYPLLIDNKGKITMTPFGVKSYMLLENTHIGDVKLTEKVYAQMEEVAKGSDPMEFLNQMEQLILEDIETVKENASKDEYKAYCSEHPNLASKSSTIVESGFKCPKCGGDLRKSQKSIYCSNWKEKGCDFTIWTSVSGKQLTDNQVRDLLKYGKTEVIKGFISKAGKKFDAKIKMDKDTYKTEFEFVNKRRR